MSVYEYGFRFLVTSEGDLNPPGVLEGILEELMDEMTRRETALVFDTSVGGILAEGVVDIEVGVDAPSKWAAGAAARDFVIEAIRAIGGHPIGITVVPGVEDAGVPNLRQTWDERRMELLTA